MRFMCVCVFVSAGAHVRVCVTSYLWILAVPSYSWNVCCPGTAQLKYTIFYISCIVRDLYISFTFGMSEICGSWSISGSLYSKPFKFSITKHREMVSACHDSWACIPSIQQESSECWKLDQPKLIALLAFNGTAILMQNDLSLAVDALCTFVFISSSLSHHTDYQCVLCFASFEYYTLRIWCIRMRRCDFFSRNWCGWQYIAVTIDSLLSLFQWHWMCVVYLCNGRQEFCTPSQSYCN